MSLPATISVTPVVVAQLLADDERLPVYVHVIDHPEGRILVDTGLAERHPLVDDMDPVLVNPGAVGDLDVGTIDIVVNTHLHFDHCGGNHLFAGRPTYVQRQELDDAVTLCGYTIREWVECPGVTYVPVEGQHELYAGVRLLPAPGHTRGSQVVVVESGGAVVVIAGDSAVSFSELDQPQTEGQHLIRSLNPDAVWLSHAREPWRPAGAGRSLV